MKEAAVRIKINWLLENAGWRFFADAKGPANIQLEPSVTVKTQDLDALGENFEKSSQGFIDFLLLNEKTFPVIVLEAKAEDKSPGRAQRGAGPRQPFVGTLLNDLVSRLNEVNNEKTGEYWMPSDFLLIKVHERIT